MDIEFPAKVALLARLTRLAGHVRIPEKHKVRAPRLTFSQYFLLLPDAVILVMRGRDDRHTHKACRKIALSRNIKRRPLLR
jgi:hypothetical protein